MVNYFNINNGIERNDWLVAVILFIKIFQWYFFLHLLNDSQKNQTNLPKTKNQTNCMVPIMDMVVIEILKIFKQDKAT